MNKTSNIRNFAIIAHIDHGKSTLADRFLELTGVVEKGKHQEQLLDRNPVSRERGITIKLAPVRMEYSFQGERYILNLIDTPGHVDFSYEVDRTLSCVEGVILLVDATQGIQAQTIANAYKAIEKGLKIIPVINKIDLPTADIEQTKIEISEFLGVNTENILEVSAKTGKGVENLLHEIIKRIPPPLFKDDGTQALIFDSYFHSHTGVVALVRMFSGSIHKGDMAYLHQTRTQFKVIDVGYFTPNLHSQKQLSVGDVGYIITNLKDIHQATVGDTISLSKNTEPLPGYKKIKPMIFASIFPTDSNEYLYLKKAFDRLYLTDSSLQIKPIYSKALGSGFRVGFLGLLHADVIRERLEIEFNQSIIITPPTVQYKFEDNKVYEPMAKVTLVTPKEHMASLMRLVQDYRAEFINMYNKSRVFIVYRVPFSELIGDFFDKVKSVSSGYASFDWEFDGYKEAKVSKLDILINGDLVEEFSQMIVYEKSQKKARELVLGLKKIIPRQQFEVRIQGKYKGKIIASERIPPFRKDVTAKLYGGDRTRKDKLLKKQKKGKKKMKMIGKVEIPKSAFLKIFKQRQS